MAHINRVTEKPTPTGELYLVTASWIGGHDGRRITLENFFISRREAIAELERLRRHAFEQGSRAMTMMAIGKKAAGRLLDGRAHDEMPA